ncbi:hypothetical protein EDC61_102267 [Sulfuritortus calidifontis]|uniref:Roadblock/LC7 domain-containing protein n=1 Tax=Sulfuritortus calidifontis TaxID=1914471 RepID=A0A4R3JY77_9PROT|nr:roadblock/LC7 domain-containing protein [Sulfuritortus calidifontis]TCS73489.1 hypothetical protein EDC61_102267 [Sulfuritortus calidifontis]
MSERLSLKEALYAQITAAGAYYAVASPTPDPSRKLLINIMKEGHKGTLNQGRLMAWTGTRSLEQALQLLYRLQQLDFVQGASAPSAPPQDNLETMLPALLGGLSQAGRALLADDNGFYLGSAGFLHEAAEEIAALAGDILSLSQRHARLLKNNLNIGSSAWAIADPSGNAELGFYPLHVGKQSFVLIIGGTPQLQGDGFVTLVQALSRRYA